jgi:hypothetical protein
MDTQIIGASVQGASHRRVGKECQDSHKYYVADGVMILAAADGHGSESCPYSKTGSVIAVNLFCKIMGEYCVKYADDMERLLTYFNRDGDTKVAQSIDAAWKQRVAKAHSAAKRERTPDIYAQYGTTLIGLLITPIFRFAFQLGDGDIAFIDAAGVSPLLDTEKILGVETHSLSKPEAWKKAVTAVHRLAGGAQKPYAYILTTDGFANSYPGEEAYGEAVRGYFDAACEHGAGAVKENLKNWLTQTSEQGCGDDITLLMAYTEGSGGSE